MLYIYRKTCCCNVIKGSFYLKLKVRDILYMSIKQKSGPELYVTSHQILQLSFSWLLRFVDVNIFRKQIVWAV